MEARGERGLKTAAGGGETVKATRPEADIYDRIHVLRYMGNKKNLLRFIIPELVSLVKPGEAVLDLMAGSQAVAYALKRRNTLWVNDVEPYSHCLGLALIENNRALSLEPLTTAPTEGYFTRTYADTYFSAEQCREIDGLRGRIEECRDVYRRALYLTALIYAMCYAQSTPGHFAQFLPPDHPRVRCLRGLSLSGAFLAKCAELAGVVPTPFRNRAFRSDWRNLLGGACAPWDRVGLIYIDPPYSGEQYSRFYHLLNTAVLNDEPDVQHLARYRKDRFKSAFCYPRRVRGEFRDLFQSLTAVCPRAAVVVSYGSRGLLEIEELAELAGEVYPRVEIKEKAYTHSTLGKGAGPVKEYLLVARR